MRESALRLPRHSSVTRHSFLNPGHISLGVSCLFVRDMGEETRRRLNSPHISASKGEVVYNLSNDRTV